MLGYILHRNKFLKRFMLACGLFLQIQFDADMNYDFWAVYLYNTKVVKLL